MQTNCDSTTSGRVSMQSDKENSATDASDSLPYDSSFLLSAPSSPLQWEGTVPTYSQVTFHDISEWRINLAYPAAISTRGNTLCDSCTSQACLQHCV